MFDDPEILDAHTKKITAKITVRINNAMTIQDIILAALAVPASGWPGYIFVMFRAF